MGEFLGDFLVDSESEKEHLIIDGLSFRPIRGPQDAVDLVAVHLDRKDHDQVDPLSTSRASPP